MDLDGTILNSVHPAWKPYKEGQDNYRIDRYLDRLPFFPGAKEFILNQQQNGEVVLIVSDSHPKYVEPISKLLGCDSVSLADKPNASKLLSYMENHPRYKEMLEEGDCIFIGDTVLDIELARRLCIPAIWMLPYRVIDEIKNDKEKIGDKMAAIKMGPTFSVASFAEIQHILDNPINNLYSIESILAGGESSRAIRYSQNKFMDGSYATVRCLARQESGLCDKYARADKYYLIANPDRPADLVASVAKGISFFLNQPAVTNQGWDYISYLTDKQTTVPRNKMKEIFEMIETSIPKISLFKWADVVAGSLRNMNFYKERRDFLEQYLSVDVADQGILQKNNDNRLNINGKNIIVIDDQLTTSATAWYVIHKLKAKGAKNILFIALFQMILSVESNVLCPNCGKQMSVKIRRNDGYKFYSCSPPKFGGEGCGCTIDYQKNEEVFAKYLKIVSKYEWAFKAFINGRKFRNPNMMQYVVDSEDKIHLISEMLTHHTDFISDRDIENLYKLRDKSKVFLDSNPLRKNVWKEWAVSNMNNDYWDSPREMIIWTLKNLDKLDEYIKMKGYEN